MKINIDVRGLDGVKRQLDGLRDGLKSQAMSAAINKTAQKARTEINRAITQEYAVKADEVRSAIDLRSARGNNLEATIDIFGSKSKRGRSANMIRFLAVMQAAGMPVKTRGAKVTRAQMREVGRQLGFLVRRGGGVKQIKGAFVANNGRTVFMRTGKERLPIKPVRVIGFSQMFASKKISERVMGKINTDFKVEIERAIAMVMARRS